nr:ATP-dependent DNA helicase PIF1-like [Tanacetum cinerariifolium]
MLLNVVRGPQKFEHLLIVNDKICATFKEACFAYGLLNDDKEWTRAIQEASLWALGPQLHDLFMTILLFCDAVGLFTTVGDAKVPARIKDGEDKPTWVEMPETFLIPSSDSPIQQIVEETYPNFIQRQKDDAYLREVAILTPRNDDSDAINAYMFDKLASQAITYHSADEICKASTEILDQHNLYRTEFLNTLNFQGMPPTF